MEAIALFIGKNLHLLALESSAHILNEDLCIRIEYSYKNKLFLWPIDDWLL